MSVLGNTNVELPFTYREYNQLHTRAHYSIAHIMRQRKHSKLAIVSVGNPMGYAKM